MLVEKMYANEEEPPEVRVQFEPDNIPDNNAIKVESKIAMIGALLGASQSTKFQNSHCV